MKTLISIIISTATVIFLSGCQEKLLEKYPITTVNPSTFWANESDAEMAVNDLYRYLPAINQIMMDRMSDIAIESAAGKNFLITGAVDDTFSDFQSWWANNYSAVSAVNRFIKSIELVPEGKISKEKHDRMIAEARVIRAIAYTFLVNYFGNVPFFTNPIEVSEASTIFRTDKQTVLDFIETELTEAAEILSVKYTGGDIGRITKGAALAWKARAMLWSGQFSKTAAAAKAVMDLGVYELEPDYAKLFRYAGEYNNKEVILERIYTVLLPHNFTALVAPYELTGQSATMAINATKTLVDSYETANGLSIDKDPAYNPEDPYRNLEPRYYATIWSPVYRNGAYADTLWGKPIPFDCRPGARNEKGQPCKDILESTQSCNMTGFLFKKYTNPEDMANINACHQNYIILRYADVLLMYAEAQNEISGPDPSIYKAINDIRHRARLPELPAGLSKEEMRTKIRHERMIELAMEGLRFYDMRRWNIVKQVMPDGQAVAQMYYYDIATGEKKMPKWTRCIYNFPVNADNTFSIPFKEYNINPNLLPNNAGWNND